MKTNKNKLVNIYLDWVDHYLTLEHFAIDYGLSEIDAEALINLCKKVHNINCLNP